MDGDGQSDAMSSLCSPAAARTRTVALCTETRQGGTAAIFSGWGGTYAPNTANAAVGERGGIPLRSKVSPLPFFLPATAIRPIAPVSPVSMQMTKQQQSNAEVAEGYASCCSSHPSSSSELH